jgi:hypothetical protein
LGRSRSDKVVCRCSRHHTTQLIVLRAALETAGPNFAHTTCRRPRLHAPDAVRDQPVDG